MNKTVLGLIFGLALGSGATWVLLHHDEGESAAAKKDAAAPGAKPEEKPNPLRLDAAKREQAGVTLVKPAAQTLTPEVPAFGRVLDPTTLATIAAEVETARAALEGSEKEFARAKKLFAAGGNASAQAVETAQAAAARDRAALNSAQARLGASWGPRIGQSMAAISAALAQGGTLIRLDVLPGESPAPAAKEARVTLAGQTAKSFTAEIIGPAPSSDAQVQGASFLALVREAALPTGAALRATLPGEGEATPALVLPRSAVVYHQGSAWIFVLGEEDTFERKLVTVGRGVGADGVAILAGAEADERVAATGAQQLLAAELQSGGGAEEP
jgi:hypothetical protein